MDGHTVIMQQPGTKDVSVITGSLLEAQRAVDDYLADVYEPASALILDGEGDIVASYRVPQELIPPPPRGAHLRLVVDNTI